jgi:hypothetical protein
MAKKKNANIKAGKLISKFLRSIADEKTELGEEADIVTKAEALARNIWKMALGYVEEIEQWDGLKMVGVKKVNHRPDKSMMELLLERMEGRVPNAQDGDEVKDKIPERVSEQTKDRVNKLADEIS